MEDLSRDTEIQKALKEFEAKNAEQIVNQSPASQKVESPKMIIWALKYSGGLIKNERQADYILLAFVIITVAVSLTLFFQVKTPSNTDIEEEKMYPPGSPALR